MREDDNSFHHMIVCIAYSCYSVRKFCARDSSIGCGSAYCKISTEECAEHMPLIMYDIFRYYKNQLVLEPDHEDMHMSKDDEEVLAFHEDNLTEI